MGEENELAYHELKNVGRLSWLRPRDSHRRTTQNGCRARSELFLASEAHEVAVVATTHNRNVVHAVITAL